MFAIMYISGDTRQQIRNSFILNNDKHGFQCRNVAVKNI